MKAKIGIIGGGRESGWWKRFFEARGHTLLVSDCAENNFSVIKKSDIIVIAVPISSAKDVARQIVKESSEDQLVISVCGLMTAIEKILMPRIRNTVFLHRMIGQQVPTMKGHNMIVNCPLKASNKWNDFVKEIIVATEANIVHAISRDHDQMVGLTQAMARIITLGLGMVAMEAPLPVTHFTNVPFSGLMVSLARILDFGHLLSRDMVFENPFAKKWIDKLHSAMLQIEGGEENFEELFSKLQKFLGNESTKAGSQALASMPSWWN